MDTNIIIIITSFIIIGCLIVSFCYYVLKDNLHKLKGRKGETGPQGKQGEKGNTGKEGPIGPRGYPKKLYWQSWKTR